MQHLSGAGLNPPTYIALESSIGVTAGEWGFTECVFVCVCT